MPLQDALVRCCSSPDPFVDTEDDEYIICFNCGEKHDSEELLSAMRVQTESRRTSRRSVTGNRYTKDVKGGSATASVPEVNDKDAQPKKVNFDIPDVLPPRDTLSRNERCADLRKFIDYLQGINMQNPLTCVMNDDVGPCDYPIARRYQRDHPGKFKDAAEILIRDADLVHKYDFIKVVRTYFCGTHDFSMSSGRKAFRVHFLKLWEESPDELHAEVWDALRKCERNIYPRGHSTPQQERPGLDRAVNSVPKEVPRASKTTTPSLDPTVEPPTRPWTAQGNLTRGSKPLRFESDVTPSKTFRGPSWSTLAIATESKTDSSDTNSCDAGNHLLDLNERKQVKPTWRPLVQPSNQSKKVYSRGLFGRPIESPSNRDSSVEPHKIPESPLEGQKLSSNDLPEPFGDKNPASEARRSPLSNEKVKGSSAKPGSTRIKPRTDSVLSIDSQRAISTVFGSRPFSDFKFHMGPESSLKGTEFSIFNQPKTSEYKVPGLEDRRSPLFAMEAPDTGAAPSWWPNRDADLHSQLPSSDKDLEGTFTPFKGKSIFDKLGEGGRTVNKDHIHAPQTSIITPRLPSPPKASQAVTPPSTTPDIESQLALTEIDRKKTSTPTKGKLFLEKLGDGDNSADKLHDYTPQHSTVIPQLNLPPQKSQETVPRITKRDVEFPLPGAWIESCETPVTPTSDPITWTPELFPPSRDLQDTPKQTTVPHVGARNDQTPIVSHEQSIERASSSDSRNEGTPLESLTAVLEDLDIASPFDETPLFREDSRSRTSSPLPQSAVQSPCGFPPRNAASIAREIRKILKKEITGSIYVLEAPEFFSTSFEPSRTSKETWYKIGIAADVDERVKQITSACCIPGLKEVYSTDPNTRYDVLKVIEAVCHAQLHNSRRYMDCGRYGASSKCVTKHKEWFAVPKDVAINTVKMWKAFLDHNPYGHDGTLDERWSSSLKKNFPLLEHHGRLDEDKLLRHLEAWIRRTVEDQS